MWMRCCAEWRAIAPTVANQFMSSFFSLLLTKFLPLSNHPCAFFVRVFFFVFLPLVRILQLLNLEPLRSLCVCTFLLYSSTFVFFFHFVVYFPSTYSLGRRETAKTIWILNTAPIWATPFIYKFSVVNREFQTFSSFIFLSVRVDGLLYSTNDNHVDEDKIWWQSTKHQTNFKSLFNSIVLPCHACYVPCVCVSAWNLS